MEVPESPATGVAALEDVGEPAPFDESEYVRPFGLGDDDVPALVELARRWVEGEPASPSAAMWAPVHAWRALAELRAPAVIPMFLEMLDDLDRRGDDWFLDEFPRVCERIGASAVDPLATYALDTEHSEHARIAAVYGMKKIAAADPSARDPVCEALAGVLAPLSEAHPELNAFVISYLTDPVAAEHADLIKRAFDAEVVSEDICGEWSRIAFELGVGPAPPPLHPMLERMPS